MLLTARAMMAPVTDLRHDRPIFVLQLSELRGWTGAESLAEEPEIIVKKRA